MNDEDIQRLADEAEAGYDLDKLKPRGTTVSPHEGSNPAPAVYKTAALPDEL